MALSRDNAADFMVMSGAMARRFITVSDIGSFHVGGQVIRLEGLPLRERVSTSGGPVHHVDPKAR